MRTVRFCCITLLLVLAGQVQAHAQTEVPRFERASCPFSPGLGIVEGRDVRCGYLIVPENRAVTGGKTVRLAVAIFAAESAHPAPDPVIFLQGGPGGGIVAGLGAQIDRLNVGIVVGDHDLILIDQRGTGASKPSLACPELTRLGYATLNQNLSARRAATLQNQALQRCHQRLIHAGVDLSAYSTHENAADIAALRQALGYTSVDLYGGSYGTRLALEVMRSFPDGVRSVVLDSVVTPRFDIYTDPLRNAERSFEALFNACKRSSSCNAAHPHLRTTFLQLATRLEMRPLHFRSRDPDTGRVYPVLLNGDGLVGLVFTSLYQTSLIPQIPDMIGELQHGRTSLASRVFGAVGFVGNAISFGMYYSVECSDDAPATTTQQIQGAALTLPAAIRQAQLTGRLADFRACAFWHVRASDPAQRLPVRSSIPTLVMSGEFDPITPPANGVEVTQTLSNGYYFQFPGMGHGVRFADPCPRTMVTTFFDDPSHRPDASCIGHMRGPFTAALGTSNQGPAAATSMTRMASSSGSALVPPGRGRIAAHGCPVTGPELPWAAVPQSAAGLTEKLA